MARSCSEKEVNSFLLFAALFLPFEAAKEGVVVSGGVQTYWVTEGGTVTPSKPKIKSKELMSLISFGLKKNKSAFKKIFSPKM